MSLFISFRVCLFGGFGYVGMGIIVFEIVCLMFYYQSIGIKPIDFKPVIHNITFK